MTSRFHLDLKIGDPVLLLARNLKALRRRARWIRAFSGAVRWGAGSLLLLFPLLFARAFLPLHPSFFLGAFFTFTFAGALYGALAPLPLSEVARLADRRLLLEERLSTAVELMERGEGGEVGEALLRDAALLAIPPEKVFPLPLKETRVLLLFLPFILLLSPPPLPKGEGKGEASFPRGKEQGERGKAPLGEPFLRKEGGREDSRSSLRLRGREKLHPLFRDAKLNRKSLDFQSFLHGADERLKLLALTKPILNPGRGELLYPFPSADRGRREVKGGNLSLEALKRRFESGEFGGSGKGGRGRSGRPLFSRSEALSRPPSDRIEAVQKLLQHLRRRAERPFAVEKGLRQGVQEGVTEARGLSWEEGEEERGKGGFPGQDPFFQEGGEPTPRLKGQGEDLYLPGQLQEGKREAYLTSLLGLGVKIPSRYSSRQLLSYYRRIMEEALSREPIPFAYREQVKRYFTSLEPE